MKEIYLIFTFLIVSVLTTSSQIELIREHSSKTFEQLDKNYEAVLKENVTAQKQKSGGGMFSSFKRLIFGKKSQINVQVDLNELAQLYEALNSADIAAIYFLRQKCQLNGLFDPTKDPRLCADYPEILTKEVQNRLGVINSCIVHSFMNVLTTPPNWLYHVITASELMQSVDPKGILEYRTQQAVVSAVSPEQYKEFTTMPNIINKGKLQEAKTAAVIEVVKKEVSDSQIQLPIEPVKSTDPIRKDSNADNAANEIEKEKTGTYITEPAEKKSESIVKDNTDSSVKESLNTINTEPIDNATMNTKNLTISNTETVQPSLSSFYTSNSTVKEPRSSEQELQNDPKVTINRTRFDSGSGGHQRLEVHVQL